MADSIKVIFDDKQVMAWMKKLQGKMSRLSTIMQKASDIMRQDVVHHIDTDKKDSSGKPWPKSKSVFSKGSTLVRGGDLRSSIIPKYSKTNAAVHAQKEYAAIHNYGGVIKPKKAKALYIPLTKDGMRTAGEKKAPENAVYGEDWVFAKKSVIPKREFMWISDNSMLAIEKMFLNEVAD